LPPPEPPLPSGTQLGQQAPGSVTDLKPGPQPMSMQGASQIPPEPPDPSGTHEKQQPSGTALKPGPQPMLVQARVHAPPAPAELLPPALPAPAVPAPAAPACAAVNSAEPPQAGAKAALTTSNTALRIIVQEGPFNIGLFAPLLALDCSDRASRIGRYLGAFVRVARLSLAHLSDLVARRNRAERRTLRGALLDRERPQIKRRAVYARA